MQLKTAPSTQLASLPPQLPFILLSTPPASVSWSPSPTAVHAVFMCGRPPHHLSPSVSSGQIHCLWYLSPVYSPHYHCHDPSPTSFPHSQSCDSPPTSRRHHLSRGFDVLPDLAQPQVQPSTLQVRHSSPTRLKFPDYKVQLSPPHLLVLARLPSKLLLFI